APWPVPRKDAGARSASARWWSSLLRSGPAARRPRQRRRRSRALPPRCADRTPWRGSGPRCGSIDGDQDELHVEVPVDLLDPVIRADGLPEEPESSVLDQRPLPAGKSGERGHAGRTVLDLLDGVLAVEGFALRVDHVGDDGLAGPSAMVVAPEEIALGPVVAQVHPVAPAEPEREPQRERSQASHKTGARVSQRPERGRHA